MGISLFLERDPSFGLDERGMSHIESCTSDEFNIICCIDYEGKFLALLDLKTISNIYNHLVHVLWF
jgi:hypothetical protein